MKPRRMVAYLLFGVASLTLFGVVAGVVAGDPKGFGSFVFAGFFIAMAGWLIGDF